MSDKFIESYAMLLNKGKIFEEGEFDQYSTMSNDIQAVETPTSMEIDLPNFSYSGCTFAEAMCTAFCVANDMKHIHFHVCGDGFDTVHNGISTDYYTSAGFDADDFAEFALEVGELIVNPGRAGEYIDWVYQYNDSYTKDEAFSVMSNIIARYLDVLNGLRNSNITEPQKSKIDDKILYWSKELDYKLARR